MPDKSPWWQELFSSPLMVASQRRLAAMTPTQAEADFLQNIFAPRPQVRILDVPCGNGRLTVELARRGFQLTGVDFTADLLADGIREAEKLRLEITFDQRDMRDLPWKNMFDHAFCFGNSFAYFEDEGNARFVKAVHDNLRPGGTFVLETRLIAESIFLQRSARQWFPLDEGFYFLHDTRYEPSTSQLTSFYTLFKDGEIDKHQAYYRIYTYQQLMALFEQAGFVNLQGYGSLSKEPFQLGANVLYVVGTKPR